MACFSFPLLANAAQEAKAAGQPAGFADRFGIADSQLTLYPNLMDPTLDGMNVAGGRWARVGFFWYEMELSQGNWYFGGADLAIQKAQQRGIKILGILGGPPKWANGEQLPNYPPLPAHIADWKNYVKTVCSRFKGKVDAWEIWNEENISQFWAPAPDSAAYVSLVSNTTPTIRTSDPAATIVMGGVAGLGYGYLQECLSAGVANFIDAVAYHPYSETINGGTSPSEPLCRTVVSLVRSLITQYTTKPLGIWLTELGWTTAPTPNSTGVDEHTQACYLLRTFISYADTDVERVIWYSIYDEPPSGYGLLKSDFSSKPAQRYFHVFQDVFGTSISSAPGAASYSCSKQSTLEAHAFNLSGGGLALAVWKADDGTDSLTLTTNRSDCTMPIMVNPATGREQPASNASRGADGRITVSNLAVGKQPVILKFGQGTSASWYLAEGTTAWGFETYITIQNPNASNLDARVTYMPTGHSTVQETVNLPAMSQTTLTNDHLEEKMGAPMDFSTRVQCSDPSKAIAVDRTMTWTGTGAASPEGHSSVGVTTSANTWYLAEGSSNWNFETWLLIQNPNSTKATCTVTYMTSDAGPKVVNHDVPAHSRASFSMADDIGAADASIKITSDVPVIPERAMYRDNRREGHDSIGTTTPAPDYFLAEGTTAWGFTTYVLIQNPNDGPCDVTLTYMTSDGPRTQPALTLAASSRKTIRVNDVPGMGATDFSTKVHGSRPIIAERAMYWDNGTGEACHDSIGMDRAHQTFYLPDGQSSEGRETWTLVQNPNTTDVVVEITYLTPDGKGDVKKEETVKASSRRSFGMLEHSGITGRAAIMVTSRTAGKRIMVERAMYWNSRGAGTDTIGGYGD